VPARGIGARCGDRVKHGASLRRRSGPHGWRHAGERPHADTGGLPSVQCSPTRLPATTSCSRRSAWSPASSPWRWRSSSPADSADATAEPSPRGSSVDLVGAASVADLLVVRRSVALPERL